GHRRRALVRVRPPPHHPRGGLADHACRHDLLLAQAIRILRPEPVDRRGPVRHGRRRPLPHGRGCRARLRPPPLRDGVWTGSKGRAPHQPMLRTSSSRSTKKSALSCVMHSGGLILSTFEWSPVAWSITPSSRSRSQTAVASSVAGTLVSGSRTSSTPW